MPEIDPLPPDAAWKQSIRNEWVAQRNTFDSRLLSMSWGTLAALGGALLTAKQPLSPGAIWCGLFAGVGLLMAVASALIGIKRNADYLAALLTEEAAKLTRVKKCLKLSDYVAVAGFAVGLLAACGAVGVVAYSKMDKPSTASKAGQEHSMSDKKPTPSPSPSTVRKDSLDGLERLKPTADKPVPPPSPQPDKPAPSDGKK